MSKEGGAAGILEAAVRGSGSRYGQRKGGIGWIKEHAGRYGSERADLLVRIAVEQDPRPARWLAMQRQRDIGGHRTGENSGALTYVLAYFPLGFTFGGTYRYFLLSPGLCTTAGLFRLTQKWILS